MALGGIWLDDIRSPDKETLYDVPGGSVAFGKMYFPPSKPYIAALTMQMRQLHSVPYCTRSTHPSRSHSLSELATTFPPLSSRCSHNGT